MNFFLLSFSFFFGLIFGSFFNVLAWRLPRNQSIVTPGSRCPVCSTPIRWFENIPVISFFVLRGRCSTCRHPISIRYPLVELTTGFAAALLWIHFFNSTAHPPTAATILVYVVQALSLLFLLPTALIDIDYYIIPDWFTIPGMIIGVLVSLLPGGLSITQSLLGLVCGGGVLYGVGLFGTVVLRKSDAMGGGDVKLMAWIGSLFSWKIALTGIVFGSFLGALAGGIMIVVKKMNRDHRIPFGPYLGAGVWLAVLYGEKIIHWYFTAVDAFMGRIL